MIKAPQIDSRKTGMRPTLISLDVGGTLGFSRGQTITRVLAQASGLPLDEVRTIVREMLHVVPEVTDEVISSVCTALRINPTQFPKVPSPASFELYPWTNRAARVLSMCAPVVTLSNVSPLDFNPQTLRECLGEYVIAQYPSCRLRYAKPDRRAFEAVAGRHSGSTATLIHIGDSWDFDILGALASGARAIWLSGGRPCPAEAYQCLATGRVAIADTLEDAAEYVRALAALPVSTGDDMDVVSEDAT